MVPAPAQACPAPSPAHPFVCILMWSGSVLVSVCSSGEKMNVNFIMLTVFYLCYLVVSCVFTLWGSQSPRLFILQN